MAKRLGIKKADAEKMIKVIEFMKEKGDADIHHYSHYYEYIAHRDLATYREEHPQLDNVISTAIQAGSIKDAKDIRKLKGIATAALKKHNRTATRQLAAITEGTTNIYDAYEKVDQTGIFDDGYKKLVDFQSLISTPEFSKQLKQSDPKKINYELKKILRVLSKIAKEYDINYYERNDQ